MTDGKTGRTNYREIRNVSPEELEFIVKYYGVIPTKVIIEILGISRWKLHRIVKKLGLKGRKGGYPKYIVIRNNSETVIYHRE